MGADRRTPAWRWITKRLMRAWTRPRVGPGREGELVMGPLGCRHTMGSTPAGVVEEAGVAVSQHYTCDGCGIIVDTRPL